MWSRWTCWLAAVLLISACSHGTPTRVVRTDGTAVVGELIDARPDAVVVKVADGTTLTIPRSTITAIESAPNGAVASNTPAKPGPPSPAPAKPGPPSPAPSNPGPSNPAPSYAPPATPSPSSSPSSPAVARHELVAPSGTTLELSLSTPIGSDTSAVDDKVDAVLRAPLTVNGEEILNAGAVARGIVIEATPSAKADGRGRLAVRFDTIQLGQRSVPIQAAPVRWEAPGVSRRAPAPEKHGLFGKIVSSTKKGLHIGEDGKARPGSSEVRFQAGALVRIRLEQPAHIAP